MTEPLDTGADDVGELPPEPPAVAEPKPISAPAGYTMRTQGGGGVAVSYYVEHGCGIGVGAFYRQEDIEEACATHDAFHAEQDEQIQAANQRAAEVAALGSEPLSPAEAEAEVESPEPAVE